LFRITNISCALYRNGGMQLYLNNGLYNEFPLMLKKKLLQEKAASMFMNFMWKLYYNQIYR